MWCNYRDKHECDYHKNYGSGKNYGGNLGKEEVRDTEVH